MAIIATDDNAESTAITDAAEPALSAAERTRLDTLGRAGNVRMSVVIDPEFQRQLVPLSKVATSIVQQRSSSGVRHSTHQGEWN